MKTNDYVLVDGRTPQQLSDNLQELLDEGYKVYGNPLVHSCKLRTSPMAEVYEEVTYFMQAVVRA